MLLGFEQIKGSHTGTNMAGKIYGVLNKYGIKNRILSFTMDSVSNNNKTLTKPLNNVWSSLSVEWNQLENHIPCMAYIVQLILGTFMSSIKVKSKDDHMPSGFKTDYIDKVIRLDNGFNKTVEKVICREPDILRPNLFIRTNLYPPLHKPRSIFPN